MNQIDEAIDIISNASAPIKIVHTIWTVDHIDWQRKPVLWKAKNNEWENIILEVNWVELKRHKIKAIFINKISAQARCDRFNK